jgi:hypothetical protein
LKAHECRAQWREFFPAEHRVGFSPSQRRAAITGLPDDNFSPAVLRANPYCRR